MGYGNADDGLLSPTKIGLGLLAAVLGVAGWRYLHPKATFAVEGTSASWDNAVVRSKVTNRPGLVLFTAEWCGACRALHDGPLVDPAVRSELASRYTVTVVDLTNPTEADRQRADRYGVRGIPTLIKFDAEGKEVDRTHHLPTGELLKWLRAGG